MENKKTELEEFQEAMAKNRRIQAQSLAILRRAKDANIPPDITSIIRAEGEGILKKYLCPFYHDGKRGIEINELCHFVFHKANNLFKKKFIVIDGGGWEERRIAGFSLLFRMIACNYNGKFYDCKEISHLFQTIDYNASITRNDLAEELKSYDVLFIDEFRRELMLKGFEIHWFFDEVLSQRDLDCKPTIITFGNPLSTDENSEINLLSQTSDFGNYLCMLSHADIKKSDKTLSDKILRIRVRKPE